MRFTLGFLLLLLLVCSLSPVHGVLETLNTDLKCRCMRETIKSYPIRFIQKLQISPPGNGCPKKEIIAWTKSKSIVCLDPKAKWIQTLIWRMLQRRNASSTSPVPVVKKRATLWVLDLCLNSLSFSPEAVFQEGGHGLIASED
uniref:C-X-C motif chemokine n=3 Tax=Camelus TaxID=9836 RepID=A0A9W3FKC0_CAMBA|nr:C-X-C motif chemokine 13 [Camelus bactrianus]